MAKEGFFPKKKREKCGNGQWMKGEEKPLLSLKISTQEASIPQLVSSSVVIS
jgi:hypothetical protein